MLVSREAARPVSQSIVSLVAEVVDEVQLQQWVRFDTKSSDGLSVAGCPLSQLNNPKLQRLLFSADLDMRLHLRTAVFFIKSKQSVRFGLSRGVYIQRPRFKVGRKGDYHFPSSNHPNQLLAPDGLRQGLSREQHVHFAFCVCTCLWAGSGGTSPSGEAFNGCDTKKGLHSSYHFSPSRTAVGGMTPCAPT